MQRFLSLLALLTAGLPIAALLVASPTTLVQAQNTTQSLSEKKPEDSRSHNSPCAGQPRSFKELKASFDKGRRPLASEMTGTWVEIGDMTNRPSDVPTLNCSGVTQGGKLGFVLVAKEYSVELHAVGMEGPQTETMKPDKQGSVEFPMPYYGGEVAQEHDYSCRLTGRKTLACLLAFGPDTFATEFKRTPVEEDRIFEP